MGSHPEFAVKFVLVGAGQELVEQAVGPCEFQDAVGGEEGGPELGEGVGVVGVEEGVEVHIEHEREAVGLEGAGEEVQMGQKGFTFVEACPDVVAPARRQRRQEQSTTEVAAIDVAGQYQCLWTTQQSVLGKSAKLDLRSAVSESLSANYRF